VIKPDGSTETLVTVTYDANTGCYTWTGGEYCPLPGALVYFYDGLSLLCQEPGKWTSEVLDNGTAVASGLHPYFPPIISRVRRLFRPPGAVASAVL
jgi:hypothetical protein